MVTAFPPPDTPAMRPGLTIFVSQSFLGVVVSTVPSEVESAVISGKSYTNVDAKVKRGPEPAVMTTSLSDPIPAAVLQTKLESATQTLASHPVYPIRTALVPSKTLKLCPDADTSTPPVVGEFSVVIEITMGGAYAAASVKVPDRVPAVSAIAKRPLSPGATLQTSAVSDTQPLASHALPPSLAAGDLSSIPKRVPDTVTGSFPVASNASPSGPMSTRDGAS
mmetsp:Transcript_19585/g.47131  ORF Transcript_19585/g.47131 Transcript_19585/m.47131 type:complete len:222 (+) Transcript_19585:2098-2763(+)